MPKHSKLPPADDWRARDLADWNALTFRAYLMERHQDVLNVPYVVSRSIPMEAKMIRRMIDEYGEDVVKQFIDECLRQYKPTREYPSVTFSFMYSYMRERVLPKILASKQRTERYDVGMSDDEVREWL
jgi:hypothetical protein